jgi:hypothetical protein
VVDVGRLVRFGIAVAVVERRDKRKRGKEERRKRIRVVNDNKMITCSETESASEERKDILDSRSVAQQLALADRAWSVKKRLEEER